MITVDRDSVTEGNWELKKVNDFQEFQDFDCDDDDLNDFIKNAAKDHKENLLAETYTIRLRYDEGGELTPPLAFVSLANDSIQLDEEVREKEFDPTKHYPFYPAVLVARLGVRTGIQRMDVGSQMINMVKEFFLKDNRTGCRFITVDSYKTRKVIKFYEKNGFIKLKEGRTTFRMYYDLKNIP